MDAVKKTLWEDREREIFVAKLSGVEKRFDPSDLYKRYQAEVSRLGGPDCYETLDLHIENFHPMTKMARCKKQGREYVEPTPQEIVNAQDFLANVGRATFDEKPYDGEANKGMMDIEAVELLMQFLSWLGQKKSKERNTSTSSVGDGPSGETQATTNTSPSSTAAKRSPSEEQKPQLLESRLEQARRRGVNPGTKPTKQ